jgi:hypothetical protein
LDMQLILVIIFSNLANLIFNYAVGVYSISYVA